jgi:hypothetical protein
MDIDLLLVLVGLALTLYGGIFLWGILYFGGRRPLYA